MKNRRRAFEVIDAFEAEVAAYTGAPYAVAVDSGTNALFLALRYERRRADFSPSPIFWVSLPRRTYVGVAQAARNADYRIQWRDEEWRGIYAMPPTRIVDAAKRFTSGMYVPGSLMCVSFQAGKILPIGRGGAILTDSPEAVRWLKRARFDGRTEGATCEDEAPEITPDGWHMYMTPPDAARGLWLMAYISDHNPDQVDTYPDLSTLEAFR